MCYQPEDAIFAQGRDYLAVPEPCCVGANRWEATAEAVMRVPPRIHDDTLPTTTTMSELERLVARRPAEEEEDAMEYD